MSIIGASLVTTTEGSLKNHGGDPLPAACLVSTVPDPVDTSHALLSEGLSMRLYLFGNAFTKGEGRGLGRVSIGNRMCSIK